MGERADELTRVHRVHSDDAYATSGIEAGLPTGDELTGATPLSGIAADAGYSQEFSNNTDIVGEEDVYPDSEYAEHDGSADVETTRAQIEQTRADLSQTIDAIQQKLSPQVLADQAKEAVRDATVGKAQEFVSNVGESAMNTVTNAGEAAVNTVVNAGESAIDVVTNPVESVTGLGSTIVETIRRNPIPAALTGIGIGWLFMSNRKQSSPDYQNNQKSYSPAGYSRQGTYGYPASAERATFGNTPYRAGTGYAGSSDYTGAGTGDGGGEYPSYERTGNSSSGQSPIGGAVDSVQSAVGSAADLGRDKVNQAQDAAGRVAGTVGDTASQIAGQAQDKAGHVVDQAQYQTQRAAGGLQQMLQERPLAVAAGTVALGIAIGLAIPETPKEHQLMGEARDNLLNQAQSSVQSVAGKIQTVAQEAVGAAKDEAQNQNLM